jgi:hypothetical protein
MLDIITDWRKASFLLQAPVFVVDIETNTHTDDPAWYNADGKQAASFGLSYVAPIIEVAFYVKGQPTVVLDVRGYPDDTVDFIRRVFDRDNYLVIGHNVIFDLRQLGGHFGFTLRPTVKVWDTISTALVLLMYSPDSYESSLFEMDGDGEEDSFMTSVSERRAGLFDLCARWGVLSTFDVDTLRFYKFMKDTLREDLSNAEVRISELPADHFIWKQATATDTAQAAFQIVKQYAGLDVLATYRLYVVQKNLRNALANLKEGQVYKVPNTDIAYEPFPEVMELIDWELELTRELANQAIQGVDVDRPYMEKVMADKEQVMSEAIEQALELEDPSEPHEGWSQEVFSRLLWYGRVLDALAGEDSYPTRMLSERRRYFTPPTYIDEYDRIRVEPLDAETIRQYLDGADALTLDIWADWLANEFRFEMTRNQAIKAAAKLPKVPGLNLHQALEEECFASERDPLVRQFKATLKLNWLRALLDDDRPMEELAQRCLAWKPYHLFVICNAPLPSDDDIRLAEGLVTKTYNKRVQEIKDEHRRMKLPGKPVINPRQIAMGEGRSLLSVGKKALDWYIKAVETPYRVEHGLDDKDPIPEEAQPLFRHYSRYAHSVGLRNRIVEFLQHIQRDGKLHSLIIRLAKTGRFRSSNPNLQNIPAKEMRGMLIAPPGFRITEWDYSNAENVSGAMISGDNKFAEAVMGSDFHTEMFKVYSPELYAKLKAEGDTAGLKRNRNNSKRITFARAYSAGVERLANMTSLTIEAMRKIIEQFKSNFWLLTEHEEKEKQAVIDRYERGLYPAYTPLWTGRRVPIVVRWEREDPFDPESRKVKRPNVRVTWNCLNQGGVSELASRSLVLVPKMLREKGFKSYVILNVHDSLLIAIHEPEWPEVGIEIAKVMCNIVPEELLTRTNPPLRFVTECGPENAQKWGWTADGKYPFSLEHYVNQWGYHQLTEDEGLLKAPKDREAPTWRRNRDVFPTMEAEMLHTKKMWAAKAAGNDEQAATVVEAWDALETVLRKMQADPQLAETATKLLAPAEVKSGGRTVRLSSLAERMTAAALLRGSNCEIPYYTVSLSLLNSLLSFVHNDVQLSTELMAWKRKYVPTVFPQ